MHGEPYCFLLAETTLLLLAITVAAEARPFPDLTVETIELTSEESIELPTKEAVRRNQVWCGTLSDDFDELIICVERTNRIEHFSDKARGQVQDIQSAEPTTAAERKLLANTIRDVQSDARAAERYLRIGTGIQTKRLNDYFARPSFIPRHFPALAAPRSDRR